MPEDLYKNYLQMKLDSVFEIEKPRELELVKKDGKYNYKDENGNLLSEKWFDMLWPFHDGIARFMENNKYGYIRENGEILYIKNNILQQIYLFDGATDFKDGIAAVSYEDMLLNDVHGNNFNLIDTDGREISCGYYFINDIKDGYVSLAKNMCDGKFFKQYTISFNYMSGNDHGIVSWYNDYCAINLIANGFVLITRKAPHNYTYAIFSNKGARITPWSKDKPGINVHSKQFFEIGEKVVCTDINLGGYDVFRRNYISKKRIIFGKIDFKKYCIDLFNNSSFLCSNGEDSFYTRYKPIRIYGNGIALCYCGHNLLFLHDEKHKREDLIGTVDSVEYDDNMIIDKFTGRVYFIYGGIIYNISEYYRKFLYGNKYSIKDYDVEIFTEYEWYHPKERVRRLKKRPKKNPVEKKEVIDNPGDSLSMLEIELEKETETKEPAKRFKIDNLFVPEDNHLIINPIYVRIYKLSNIDFTGVSFTNVKVTGIDFRGCNITFGENGLNPQEVYERDLRGCNFEGIHIRSDVDFTGVDIRGARFGRDNDPNTDDRGSDTFQDAIYDGSTTFDGISFFIIYGECQNRKGSAK